MYYKFIKLIQTVITENKSRTVCCYLSLIEKKKRIAITKKKFCCSKTFKILGLLNTIILWEANRLKKLNEKKKIMKMQKFT